MEHPDAINNSGSEGAGSSHASEAPSAPTIQSDIPHISPEVERLISAVNNIDLTVRKRRAIVPLQFLCQLNQTAFESELDDALTRMLNGEATPSDNDLFQVAVNKILRLRHDPPEWYIDADDMELKVQPHPGRSDSPDLSPTRIHIGRVAQQNSLRKTSYFRRCRALLAKTFLKFYPSPKDNDVYEVLIDKVIPMEYAALPWHVRHVNWGLRIIRTEEATGVENFVMVDNDDHSFVEIFLHPNKIHKPQSRPSWRLEQWINAQLDYQREYAELEQLGLELALPVGEFDQEILDEDLDQEIPDHYWDQADTKTKTDAMIENAMEWVRLLDDNQVLPDYPEGILGLKDRLYSHLEDRLDNARIRNVRGWDKYEAKLPMTMEEIEARFSSRMSE